MNNFFSLSNIDLNYEITLFEKLIPILLLLFIITILYLTRNKIRNDELLDKNLRYSFGILSSIFLSLYYILEWSTNGITAYNLPLHICFFSNILSIILCFNKNKKIFNFVVFAGILGGISSLLAPELNLSFKHFRYYQFMICHISIIVIPIYFIFVYKYTVSIKDTLKVIFTIEALGICLGIFNEIYGSNYMFVSFTSNHAARNSILYFIGQGYYYFLNLQFLFIVIILFWYLILKSSFKYLN